MTRTLEEFISRSHNKFTCTNNSINMITFIFFVIYSIAHINARTDCPQINVVPTTFVDLIREAIGLLSFRKYDTSLMKFYVMTPSSHPDFVNIDGRTVDWRLLGCNGRSVLFNCPGWGAKALHPMFIDMVRTFVDQYEGCAVTCDYSGASENRNIIYAFNKSGEIGKVCADYIEKYICSVTDCTRKLQLHGHSWGSHTCGLAGYYLSQRGLKPIRMMSSDAAGPFFNLFPAQDPRMHMSVQSASTVINIKTSALAGSALAEWAHQTQYIGLCGSAQDQCPGRGVTPSDGCDHTTSVYITKSTLNKKFPVIRLAKCSSCPYMTPASMPLPGQCSNEFDYLGWQSSGKRGIYVIKTLPECLNPTLDSNLK